MSSDSHKKSKGTLEIDERAVDMSNTLDMITRMRSLFANFNPDEYGDYDDDDSEDESPTTINKNNKTDQIIVTNKETNLRSPESVIEEEEEEEKELVYEEIELVYNSADEGSENEFYSPDYNEYRKKHENPFNNDPCFINTNINQFNSPVNPLSIQINGDLDVIDAQQNSVHSLFEIENIKKENEQIFHMNIEFQDKNSHLSVENQDLKSDMLKLKADLCRETELVKELQVNNNTSNNDLNMLQKLKSENRHFYQNLHEEKMKNKGLEEKVKKLQKYENMCKRMNFIEINKKMYQLINKIGKGGFSEVFSCVSLEDKEKIVYALKKSNLKNLDKDNKKLVFSETDTLKKLQNTDKVVKLIDHEFIESRQMYLVLMEMGSCDLSSIFKKEINEYKCVREPSRVYYWVKMLQAVLAVHELGVVHSDLKPANFVLVKGEVKLIDFNISNAVGDRTSVTVQAECGTIEYMSPDMFLKDEKTEGRVNNKLDVWSLGIILYYMTYGYFPLKHLGSFVQKMYAICDPSKKEFSFPPIENANIIDAINKCLIHDPKKRYSVSQLLDHPYTKFEASK